MKGLQPVQLLHMMKVLHQHVPGMCQVDFQLAYVIQVRPLR